ncbi:hypothetical protein E3N88_13000 [Mikania micrantha]|uniref:Reverse transcriptase n=1 Tax=Mikania micrantha TaxID=192012 RepID=A0A5N6P761_9ASTR|nr:hypothetical protein E3N88_13000 [Mikania micrantha]
MNSTLSRYRYADYGGIPTVVSQSNQSGGVRGEVKTTHPTSRSFSSSNFLSKGESGVKSGGLGSSSSNSSTRDKSVRTLSRTEWEERRKKGLCYRCGQLYGPTHRCPEGKLRVLLLGEDEEIADLGEQLLMTVLPSSSVAQEFDPPDGSCQVLEIMASCNQLCGHQTLQLDGILLGIPICLLVDSGATHNFISKRLVSALAIPFTTIDGIKIRLGDGHVVMVTTQCQQLSVQIGPCTFVINALVFDTGSLDLILGMEWLQSLGPVTHDWKNAWMQFTFHDSRVVLQGGGTNTHSNASLQTWLRKESKPQLTVINLLASMMTVSNSHSNSLSSSQQQSLSVLLNDFTSIFQIPSSLPPSRSYDHQIILSTSDPIAVRPYRYPHIQKNEIEKQVKELLSVGMIRPSRSAYSSPVILVKKKDSSWRMCVDYRALNKVTIPDKFPIPMVEELLDELHGAKFFTKLDLKSGYNQIRMQESSIEKTAFRTHEGHYEYLVMPFGLMNAPATFQAIMNDIFKPFLRKFVVIFFDDILIYSPDWVTHLRDIQAVFQTLVLHSFFLNQKKCTFGQTSVEYLGHLITGQGVSMDPKKIEAVAQWPTPSTIKGLRGFLGLTGYYRKFIQFYGSIARPLTDFTKKNAFVWSTQAHEAFINLKNALISAPVLALPNFSLPFTIECDASGRGIGAVLTQQQKPIAYFSKGLSDKNLAKSAYEREMMALVLAVQHWRPYLLGTRFIVCTDQKSLKFLLQQRVTTPDQQNWVAKLLGYNFDIQYKPGKSNKAADALSRREEMGVCFTLNSGPIWVQGSQLIAESKADPVLQKLGQDCQLFPDKHPGFVMKHDVLFYHNRLVISANSKFLPVLLHEFHTTPTGGHSGYYRTYRRMAANLYWAGMTATVKQYVRECEVCQRCKAATTAPAGLLQPLNIPNVIWEELSMDFISGLPRSKGFTVILVVVDRLSKYAHFIPLKHPYTAKAVAEVFVKEIVRLHGIPKNILSDRDPLFLSNFWQEVFRAQGTTLSMSSAYHPESDGQTEVINRCLETYLRCFAVDQPKMWAHWLPWAEFWYNSTFHSSTGQTPFQTVYGRSPPTVFQYAIGEVKVEAVAQELKDRDVALQCLKEHLGAAQQLMKQNADKKRKEVFFKVGEWVYVKLKPYRQQSVASRLNQKLSPRFFGPFQIIAKVGLVAYKLELPPTSKIHPVFHVSLLKKAVQGQVEPIIPSDLEFGESDIVQPSQILDVRKVQQGSDLVEEWLIQWQGQLPEEATWEMAEFIQEQFPNLSLELFYESEFKSTTNKAQLHVIVPSQCNV